MNLKHETFIREMIAHGDRQRVYLVAYPQSSPEAAYINACRLLKRPEISTPIREVQQLALQTTIMQLGRKYEEPLADTYELRLALARVVRGQVSTEKEVVRYNKKIHIKLSPSVTDVLKAIDLNMKLEREAIGRF